MPECDRLDAPPHSFHESPVSMFTFLLVVHAIIAAILVVTILVQRSEGGGLGMGGSPSGLMSARGAADFLTRATAVLATIFVLMSIALAAYASVQRAPQTIDTSLARKTPLTNNDASAAADPLAAAADKVAGNAAAPVSNDAVPLAK